MKDVGTKYVRAFVQALIFINISIVVILYYLYAKGVIGFKILGVGDLNPYGGWSAVREYATDSSYVFEGISISMALTIAILLSAIIGGRFFCGWICPLGAAQDLFSLLGRRLRIPEYRLNGGKALGLELAKYPVLLVILLMSVFGYGAVAADFSPWRALLSLPKLTAAWPEMKLSFGVLGVVLLAAVFVPRLFCRYLCPLGAAQALFSSLGAISLNRSRDCKDCKVCTERCPAGLKLSSDNAVHSPECIRCLDCTTECRLEKGRRMELALGKASISPKVYILFMLAVIFMVWLGLPHIWQRGALKYGTLPEALKDGIYSGEARGFAGSIVTEVAVSQGKLTEIRIIEHRESSGWYEEVFMLLPGEMIKKQRIYVDEISGATRTSRGLIKSVENAVKKAF